MNGGDPLFHRLWGGSLVAHLLFFAVFFVLPSGGSGQKAIPVYRVTIVDLPAQPVAPQLDFSEPPLSAPEAETAPAPPEPPPPLQVPTAAVPPPAPQPPAPPGPSVPAQTSQPAAPMQPAVGPPVPTEAPQVPSRALPALPAAPTKTGAATPAAPPPLAGPAAPSQAASATRAETDSLMERTRQRVQTLQLKFEEPTAGRSETGGVAAETLSSRLSLRIYQNSLREEIQRRYHFPGNFDRDLRARVRITVNRDGTVAKTEILASSGHEPFDLAVKLTLRRAKFPPIPDSIPGETVMQVVQFSPDTIFGGR